MTNLKETIDQPTSQPQPKTGSSHQQNKRVKPAAGVDRPFCGYHPRHHSSNNADRSPSAINSLRPGDAQGLDDRPRTRPSQNPRPRPNPQPDRTREPDGAARIHP